MADGVSGWNDYGFSSNLFARQLMDFSKIYLERKYSDEKLDPIELLKNSFKKVNSVGSSTAVLGIFQNDKINLCNIGDSGFQLYRQSPSG